MGIDDAQLKRKENLVREREFREYALLLEGVLVCMGSFGLLLFIQPLPARAWMLAVYLALVTAAALIGLPVMWGVSRMRPWARRPLVMMCIIALPIFPFGTLFALQILVALYARPRPRLLSDDYFQLVRKTAHLNPRTSLLTWVGLVLIAVLVTATIAITMLPPEYRGR